MRKLILLCGLIASVCSNAQTKEKLQGVWSVRNIDSTSKQKKEIEFQFKKKGDWIIIRSKGGLNIGASKSIVNIFERTSSFSFLNSVNGQYYTLNYYYTFSSNDVLILTNSDNAADVMTLDRKN